MSRKSSNRGARTRACRVHTRVNARRPSGQSLPPFCISARPGIVLHLRHQSCLDWIPLNISSDPVPFIFVPYPVIIRFASPELLSSASQQLIRFPRRKSFERLHQFTRRYQRKQQYVDVVCHDRKRPKLVMTEFSPLEERINHRLGDRILLEERWAGASRIQVPVHPNKRFAGGALVGRRESRGWQAAVQVPRDEQPAAFRIDMWKPALRVHSTISAIPSEKLSVAHALVRAVFALLRTQAFGKRPGVHTSVNAARRSAYATSIRQNPRRHVGLVIHRHE